MDKKREEGTQRMEEERGLIAVVRLGPIGYLHQRELGFYVQCRVIRPIIGSYTQRTYSTTMGEFTVNYDLCTARY